MEWIYDLGRWVSHWAYTPFAVWALFLLSFAEASFFPVPPDVLLIAMSVLEPGRAFEYAAVCTGGSVLGAAFGYLLGLKGGRPLLLKIFSGDRVRMVEAYYRKWDVWAVGAAGFTPIPYKIFTVSAGVFKIAFPRFLWVSLLSRGARFFLVAGAIYAFGPTIKQYLLKYFNLFTFLFILLLILGFAALRVWSRKALGTFSRAQERDTGALTGHGRSEQESHTSEAEQ